MGILDEAANVTAPEANRIVRLDISTSGTRYEIPPTLQGKYCTWMVTADTGSIVADVAFGGASVSVTLNQDSGVTSEVITIVSTTGFPLPSGSPMSFVMPMISSTITHFAVDASGDGKLSIYPSSK